MSTAPDPFGFARPPAGVANGTATVIVIRPGQEVRIVVADDSGVPAGLGDRGSPAGRSSPSGSGDKGSPAGRASPSGSGDAGSPAGRASPSGSGDAAGWGPFGFTPPSASTSKPMTIVAQVGQEIRVVVPN